MEKNTDIFLKLKFLLLVGILAGSVFFLLFEAFPIEIDDLSLPTPIKKGQMTLSTAMYQVRQSRDLRDYSIVKNNISQLLWALQGITHGPSFRTVPSAGATYPLEIFLLQKQTSTLNEGCYHYNPHGHRLKSISTSANFTLLLSALLGEDQEAVSNVSTVFFILADYSRTTDTYGSRGFQYVHLEVGHAIQNFLLQLTSLNLSTRLVTNFTSQKIQSLLNSDLNPLAILPVGITGDMSLVRLRINQYYKINTDEISVEEAIVKRKSIRDYQRGKIPLSVILDLLQDCSQIPEIGGNNSQMDLRLVVGDVEDLIAGSFNYFLENNSLYQLNQGDFRTSLKEAALNQPWVESAQLDIVISMNTTWINQQPDFILFNRLMMYSIGMIAQNVYLKCAALGLGTVVIGAFYETEVSQILGFPSSHTPIYIIPIGLTAEYFEETTGFLPPLTEMARVAGLILYIFFYISLYLSLPVLKKRLSKKMRWVHCISGIIPLIGVVFHFMIIHGYVSDLWGFINILSYLNALVYFVIDILTLPMTRYDLGMLLARLSLSFGIIALIAGIIFAFKLLKKRKILKRIHTYTIFLTIGCAITHNLLNGVIFANEPLIFLLLNILALDLYFLLYVSPDIAKIIHRQEISNQ